MTNDGFERATLELLELLGILCKKSVTNKKGIIIIDKWNMTTNYEEKRMYLCMDGLSLERYRSLERNLINQPITFSDEYEQKITFKKALHRVTEIPGPLHMAFHMCQCLYIIYSDFLKHCQNIVE